MQFDHYRCVPEPLGGDWTGREIDPAQFKRAWFNVPYADQASTQQLDVVLPDEGDGPFPVIFYIHGGGWLSGDKRADTITGLYKAPTQGYAVVAINYRYASEAFWPAQIFDAKAALRFIRAHAEEFSLDTSRIVAWGNSAGGHIANMLAATGASGVLEDKYQGNPEQTCEISGLVSWYAPIDLYAADIADQLGDGYHPLDPEHAVDAKLTNLDGALLVPQSRLLGFVPRKHRAASAMASPIEFVDDDFPPALYQHGREDSAVPWTQSVSMARRVNDACGEGTATFELFAGEHGSPLIKVDENIDRCLDFIEQAIGGAPQPRTPPPASIALR